MTITGPTGPGGNNSIITPETAASDSLGELHSVGKAQSNAPSAGATEGKAVQEAAESGTSHRMDLDEIIEQASRLLPPEQREGFLELVKDMSAADPLLRSMIRRLEGGAR